MKKIISLLILLTLTISVDAQDNTKITKGGYELVINYGVAKLPKFSNLNDKNDPVINKINQQLLKEFKCDRYDIESYLYIESDFLEFNIEDDILYLSITYNHEGQTDQYTLEVYYNLISGNEINLKMYDIVFKSMLKPESYISFFDRYLVEGLKEEVEKAYKCIEEESGNHRLSRREVMEVDYYSPLGFSIKNDSITIYNNYDVAVRDQCNDCQVGFSKQTIALDSLRPYLNDFGLKVLKYFKSKESEWINVGDSYNGMISSDIWKETGISSLLDRIYNLEKTPKYNIIFGKVNGKYPFKMVININELGSETIIKGVYSYDTKKDQNIELKGYINDTGEYEINEYIDEKLNGHFTLKQSSIGWSGTWTNADGTKTYDIEFESAF